ncbi:rod binding protein [Roseinatronobacter bogoriensis subsp. barguzinensis]|nr:rod binding protein [Rhodobaca barguzinensis]TDY68946.1 rod binding protein [Rhodobaca bogoriensis DSM 18756]
MHIPPETQMLRPPPAARPSDQPTPQMKQAAQEFEAAILSELLKAAGAGQSRTEFGGGEGEEQFASLLLDAQAKQIAAAGGIGFAEMALRGLMAQRGPEQGAT